MTSIDCQAVLTMPSDPRWQWEAYVGYANFHDFADSLYEGLRLTSMTIALNF